MVHGEEEAVKAQESAKALFAGGGNLENMPTTTLAKEDFTDGSIDIITILVKAGLVPTRSEGRRAVEQGGVCVNDEKVTDFKAVFSEEMIGNSEFIIRKGKKNFRKIIL